MAAPLADDIDFLGQLEYVNIAARRLFGGQLLGFRRSRRFGNGLEYADFRGYAQGDDVRKLYWQAYLQHRRFIIKLFEESAEINIYILVDTSGSMGRGAPEKLHYAKKLAAALSYIALGSQDRVTLVPFATDVDANARPLHGRGRFIDVLRRLDSIEPSGTTDLLYATRHFAQRYTRRGLVILLSDFFDPAGYAQAIKIFHHNHFLVTSIQINEREELDPPLRGDFELVDVETGATETARMTPAAIAAYKRALAEHYAELGRLSSVFGYQTAAANTDVPFQEFLVGLFRRGVLVR
jgi:uncharacterized protein (DUF58 family)